jgi:hypothetical protein
MDMKYFHDVNISRKCAGSAKLIWWLKGQRNLPCVRHFEDRYLTPEFEGFKAQIEYPDCNNATGSVKDRERNKNGMEGKERQKERQCELVSSPSCHPPMNALWQ